MNKLRESQFAVTAVFVAGSSAVGSPSSVDVNRLAPEDGTVQIAEPQDELSSKNIGVRPRDTPLARPRLGGLLVGRNPADSPSASLSTPGDPLLHGVPVAEVLRGCSFPPTALAWSSRFRRVPKHPSSAQTWNLGGTIASNRDANSSARRSGSTREYAPTRRPSPRSTVRVDLRDPSLPRRGARRHLDAFGLKTVDRSVARGESIFDRLDRLTEIINHPRQLGASLVQGVAGLSKELADRDDTAERPTGVAQRSVGLLQIRLAGSGPAGDGLPADSTDKRARAPTGRSRPRCRRRWPCCRSV